MKRILIAILILTPLLAFSKRANQRKISSDSYGSEAMVAKFASRDGKIRINLATYPFESTVDLFWTKSGHSISFNCEVKKEQWLCVNDCQMGAINLSFPNEFKKVVMSPYDLVYQSCDPNKKFPAINVKSKAPVTLRRVQ